LPKTSCVHSLKEMNRESRSSAPRPADKRKQVRGAEVDAHRGLTSHVVKRIKEIWLKEKRKLFRGQNLHVEGAAQERTEQECARFTSKRGMTQDGRREETVFLGKR